MQAQSDSYKKACADLLRYLSASPEVLIIDPARFRVLMLLLKAPTQLDISFPALSIIDITTLIPDIFNKIDPSGAPQYFNEPGATSLVAEYAHAWIPLGSPDYASVLKQTFIQHTDMETWQRGVRALHTQDRLELVSLSLDPDLDVRTTAQMRLKELEK